MKYTNFKIEGKKSDFWENVFSAFTIILVPVAIIAVISTIWVVLEYQ